MSDGHAVPWYRRTYRWGQTNLTEIDPVRYDAGWWREHWRRTRVQGVIVNAGGIVAYYPSASRCTTARSTSATATSTARSSRPRARRGWPSWPGWTRTGPTSASTWSTPTGSPCDADGRPYRAERSVRRLRQQPLLRRVPAGRAARDHRAQPARTASPTTAGAAWSAAASATASTAPRRSATRPGWRCRARGDWDDAGLPPVDRLELRPPGRRSGSSTTASRSEAGGPDCLWIGMNSGDIVAQSTALPRLQGDLRADRDHHARLAAPQQHDGLPEQRRGRQADPRPARLGQADPREHGDVPGRRSRRSASPASPEPEVRMWSVEGFAGGIQPWWHHIGAYHEDRRQYRTAEPLFRWHEANEQYLVDRQPGRDGRRRLEQGERRLLRPRRRRRSGWRCRIAGVREALIRARIPYVPVHADHVDRGRRSAGRCWSCRTWARCPTAQCASVRRFVRARRRPGRHRRVEPLRRVGRRRAPTSRWPTCSACAARACTTARPASADPSWESWARHSYLRLTPELRAGVYGPQVGTEPAPDGERHPALARLRRDRHRARSAAGSKSCGPSGRRRAAHVRAALPDLPARDLLDARPDELAARRWS